VGAQVAGAARAVAGRHPERLGRKLERLMLHDEDPKAIAKILRRKPLLTGKTLQIAAGKNHPDVVHEALEALEAREPEKMGQYLAMAVEAARQYGHSLADGIVGVNQALSLEDAIDAADREKLERDRRAAFNAVTALEAGEPPSSGNGPQPTSASSGVKPKTS
jgi:hypothetical protein